MRQWLPGPGKVIVLSPALAQPHCLRPDVDWRRDYRGWPAKSDRPLSQTQGERKSTAKVSLMQTRRDVRMLTAREESVSGPYLRDLDDECLHQRLGHLASLTKPVSQAPESQLATPGWLLTITALTSPDWRDSAPARPRYPPANHSQARRQVTNGRAAQVTGGYK